MAKNHEPLISKVEAFLSETGMSPSYFGQRAVGNTRLVDRLRSSGRVWPDTEGKILAFMEARRKAIRAGETKRQKIKTE